MIRILQGILRSGEFSHWIDEGENAAYYGRKEHIELFAAFLEGMAN